MIAFGPVTMTVAARRRPTGRSLTSRRFHSGMSPALVGIAQYISRCGPSALAAADEIERRRSRPSRSRRRAARAGWRPGSTAQATTLPSSGFVGEALGRLESEVAALHGRHRARSRRARRTARRGRRRSRPSRRPAAASSGASGSHFCELALRVERALPGGRRPGRPGPRRRSAACRRPPRRRPRPSGPRAGSSVLGAAVLPLAQRAGLRDRASACRRSWSAAPSASRPPST